MVVYTREYIKLHAAAATLSKEKERKRERADDTGVLSKGRCAGEYTRTES